MNTFETAKSTVDIVNVVLIIVILYMIFKKKKEYFDKYSGAVAENNLLTTFSKAPTNATNVVTLTSTGEVQNYKLTDFHDDCTMLASYANKSINNQLYSTVEDIKNNIETSFEKKVTKFSSFMDKISNTTIDDITKNYMKEGDVFWLQIRKNAALSIDQMWWNVNVNGSGNNNFWNKTGTVNAYGNNFQISSKEQSPYDTKIKSMIQSGQLKTKSLYDISQFKKEFGEITGKAYN